MTATNLFSVKSYGEFEYWFAGIKVAAIVAFLGLGAMFVFGLWPDQNLDFSNLTDQGGFLPNGPTAIFSSIVVVVFSMVGARSPRSQPPSRTTRRRRSPRPPSPSS